MGGGLRSPFLLAKTYMEQKKIVEAAAAAAEANNAFIVDLEIKPNNVIVVYADADQGLGMDQIKMINRQMEAALDRDVEDFNLTVSSPDLNRPLMVKRQYVKNVGRTLKVKSMDRQIEGVLKAVTEEGIELEVPGKKKKDPVTHMNIEFGNITEAKIKIVF